MAEINEIFPAGEAEKIKAVAGALAETDKQLISMSVSMEKVAELINKSGLSFKELGKAQAETKKATVEVDAVGKQLQATEAKLAQLEDERQAQIIKNNEAIKKRTAELKNEANQNIVVSRSINDLRNQTKALTAERNSLSTATAEGRKRITELNKAIDENNKTIKENADVALKQKMNIGNYASALEGLTGQFGINISAMKSFGESFKTGYAATKLATGGVWSFTSALIASGIGAIVVAIGVAFAAVMVAVKRLQPVMDAFNVIMAQIGAVLTVLLDRFAKFGQALISIFKGEFKEGAKQMQESWAGIGDQINNATKAAKEHEQMLQRLKEAEGQNAITIAKNNAALEEQRNIMKDQLKTKQERIDAAQKVIDLEKENLKIRQEALKNEILSEVSAGDMAKAQELLNNAIETGVAIKAEDIGATNTNREEQVELNKKIADYINLQSESQRKLGEVTAQKSGLVKQINEEERKAHEDSIKRIKEADAARLKELETIRAIEAERSSMLQKSVEMRITDAKSEQEIENARAAYREQIGTNELAVRSATDQAKRDADAANAESAKASEEARARATAASVDAMYQESLAATENAQTVQEASKGVLNTLRNEIKARLAQALASQIAKVITKVPFPFNVAAAAAAGAALNLMFNKLVPTFATGTDSAPGEFIAGEA